MKSSTQEIHPRQKRRKVKRNSPAATNCGRGSAVGSVGAGSGRKDRVERSPYVFVVAEVYVVGARD